MPYTVTCNGPHTAGVSMDSWYDRMFDNGDDSQMAFAESLKAEGKIRHIGFSTHGAPGFIKKCLLVSYK